MKRVITIFITMFILLGITIPAAASSTSSVTIPTFTILEVVKDKSVTIQTNNFPANDKFTVTMGIIGSRGKGGAVIGTTKSGSGGSFKEIYTIPPSLVGAEMIAIRLESPTSGYFSYNWFWNSTAIAAPPASPTPSPTPITPPTTPSYSGFPTFTIAAVVQGKTVTIKGVNFPANDNFDVLMGAFGTKGLDGINVGSTKSGAGGDLSATYNIPASLAASTLIAIRLQSPTSGYFAYNWFFNNTTTP